MREIKNGSEIYIATYGCTVEIDLEELIHRQKFANFHSHNLRVTTNTDGTDR